MNNTATFMYMSFFMVITFFILGWISFSNHKENKRIRRILLSEENIKKEREESIAKNLKIECTDFAVLTAEEKNAFMYEGYLRKYYSGENSKWAICTETENYEVLFKGKTSQIIYVRKLKK